MAENHGTPAARIFRDAKGNLQALNVFLHYQKPLDPEPAIERVRNGKTVFVDRESVPIVLSALGVQS